MNQLRNVDFRALQMFLTLMAERSVTRTSMLIGVSQPAITQSLNKLREAFSDPLFVRGQGEMLPTERAIRLEDEVRKFLASISSLQLAKDDFDLSAEKRSVVVTAPEYLELLLLPKISEVIRQAAPGITLSVRAPEPRKISDLLAIGDVDFRIGWVRAPQLAIRAMPLFNDDIVVIGSTGNSKIREGLTLEQYVALAHIRLLGSGRTTSGRVIDDYIKQRGKTLSVCIFAQGLLALLGTLRTSDVVATIPRRMAKEIQRNFPIKIVSFPGTLPSVKNALYWHEKTHRSPLHKWFRSLVAGVSADLLSADQE